MKCYTTTYNGEEVSLTDEDSIIAIENETAEIKRLYNPAYVKFEELPPENGAAKLLRVTVNAPTHYLSTRDDNQPKSTDSISVYVSVPHGYPIKEVKAYYPRNKYLASPNVFTDGSCCIAGWTPFSSSLTGTIDKLVKDAVHNPSVTNYSSPANSGMINWHKRGVASGEFPTLSLRQLFKPDTPPPVPRHSSGTPSAKAAPPPVPQHHGNSSINRTPARRTPPPVPSHH